MIFHSLDNIFYAIYLQRFLNLAQMFLMARQCIKSYVFACSTNELNDQHKLSLWLYGVW